MNEQKNIEAANIFSIFHDGTIHSLEEKNGKTIMIIDCIYLAEMINPDFRFFNIEIKKLEQIALKKNKNIETISMKELEELNLEILTANYEDSKVIIACDYDFHSFVEIHLQLEEITLYDESNKLITLENLINIQKKYRKKTTYNK
ncbi:hypothetical protein [Wenyingzhuangia sp. IMCC45574]